MTRQSLLTGLVFVMVLAPLCLHGQDSGDCTKYDFSWGGTNFTPNDTTGHASGSHSGGIDVDGTCTYTGANKSGTCYTVCTATTLGKSEGETLDYTLTNPLLYHTGGINAAVGTASGVGVASCGGFGYAAVINCLNGTSCTENITVNPTNTNGLAGTATEGPYTPIWVGPMMKYQNDCPSKLSPGCIPDHMPLPQGPDGGWEWNAPTCEWVWIPIHGSTPIIIDTTGTGFNLTSATNGIKWDFYGDGVPIQIAWTAPGSTNGWLALPVNGQITSARQLFSNVAPQDLPSSGAGNGFNALAFLDSNNDGVIDKNDAVWPNLRVWVDSNHDGISQPAELLTLDSLGITSISVSYTSSPRTDQYGNQFMLKGSLGKVNGDPVDRVIYDVTLVTNP
jgi:hypothetical protein